MAQGAFCMIHSSSAWLLHGVPCPVMVQIIVHCFRHFGLGRTDLWKKRPPREFNKIQYYYQ